MTDMELLKEIAKDKLVIMVTHNPDLATEYSSRIIRLSDGVVTDDSNPYESQENETKKDSKEKGKKSSDDYVSEGGGFDEGDDMLDAAIECVIEMGMASTSMLQRKLKLGYARAARIIDQMEERGIVGPFEGSKPRQVLISKEQWLEKQLQSDD